MSQKSKKSNEKKTMGNEIEGIEGIGTGDCMYIKSILDEFEYMNMFPNVKKEVNWGTMTHRGFIVPRMISIQSVIINDPNIGKIIPLYRHPVDVHPEQYEFTPFVKMLKDRTEDLLKLERDYFNHCLIQLYEGGNSSISEHSDKTLDIKKDTLIVNVSLGAVRCMKIKDKTKPISSKVRLENGSVFVLGPRTNREYYHGIAKDLRDDELKTDLEKAFNSERISLTFRNIGTFIDKKGKILGQGARKINTLNPYETIDPKEEALRMLKAFSKENHEVNFDWESNYGCGFNVIDLNLLDDTK